MVDFRFGSSLGYGKSGFGVTSLVYLYTRLSNWTLWDLAWPQNVLPKGICKPHYDKGPSINDVSPKGEGGGVQKMPKKETFTSRFEETRGGRVPQKSKIWGDVVYGWSLT